METRVFRNFGREIRHSGKVPPKKEPGECLKKHFPGLLVTYGLRPACP